MAELTTRNGYTLQIDDEDIQWLETKHVVFYPSQNDTAFILESPDRTFLQIAIAKHHRIFEPDKTIIFENGDKKDFRKANLTSRPKRMTPPKPKPKAKPIRSDLWLAKYRTVIKKAELQLIANHYGITENVFVETRKKLIELAEQTRRNKFILDLGTTDYLRFRFMNEGDEKRFSKAISKLISKVSD